MSISQTHHVMMIRPVNFKYNEETAGNNAFQKKDELPNGFKQSEAAHEFDQLVNTLQSHGISVTVIKDDEREDTPDSIFPNNWISTHATGEIILYPMFAKNRRTEVRSDIVDKLKNDFQFHTVTDWTVFTKDDQFLEGTGSLVLDRQNEIAYCCISERSNKELAEKWAIKMNYDLVYFHATDEEGFAIYHTNVMMAVAKEYVVICLDSIQNIEEREMVIETIEESEKELIEISLEQMNQFAGNMIELKTPEGKSVLVMSASAYDSLQDNTIKQIESFSTIVKAAIPTIEKNGGGSVRCMIAEVFVPN